MPKRCAAFNCRGNYAGEPYTRVVSFPKDKQERQRWIEAMPNAAGSLNNRRDLYICSSHFTCPWVSAKGGKRPVGPPNLFEGVNQSCLKQNCSIPRKTMLSTSAAREKKVTELVNEKDKIDSYESFLVEIIICFPQFHIIRPNDCEVSMTMMNDIGSTVVQFLSFKKVSQSSFGFVQLNMVQKDTYVVPKHKFKLPKSGIINRWSQIKEIIDTLNIHQVTDSDHLSKALKELKSMIELHDDPHFQFIISQLKLILTPRNNLNYPKNLVIFAAELLCVSPAAYRMLRASGTMFLPREQMIRNLMLHSFQDNNLKNLFHELKPEQRLVNVLFDEVKLKSTLRFTSGHILGHALNNSDQLATSALVFEAVCHYGGPRFILRVLPVAHLTAQHLQSFIVETLELVNSCGGRSVSVICDNCPLNQSTYSHLGGPGAVTLDGIGGTIFLVYDYVHVFKNLRNNWITEKQQELTFTKDSTEYTARWKDIQALYNEDKVTPLRLTKITHTSVFPKILQRQSVTLVCQVFHEKTCAAFKAIKNKVMYEEGTAVFVDLVTQWYKMMSVKSKYASVKYHDNSRLPWTLESNTFTALSSYCDVIDSCRWSGGGNRQKKLTQYTADAFITTTKFNIAAATNLLTEHHFEYVLPAVFSQDPLEKFFGQARQRCGGNYYIDICDVVAAAKVQRLHQLLKCDTIPDVEIKPQCQQCTQVLEDEDLEYLHDIQLEDTQLLLESSDNLKHKIVFIAGFLEHKYATDAHDTRLDGESIVTEFLEELNRGGLHAPTLSTTFFVHIAVHLSRYLQPKKFSCRTYLASLLSAADVPMAENQEACQTLANVLLKAHVCDNSDREQQLGCLRRKEKLQ